MGIIQFVAESGPPMLAPVGTAAVVLPMTAQKKWVFKTTQNDDIIAKALVGHMVKAGVKPAGYIGFNEAYGENWLKGFTEMAKTQDTKNIATGRYQASDHSVSRKTDDE